MTADEFAAALEALGFKSRAEAAERLGVKAGATRISEWAHGARPVPEYIAAAVRTHLELQRCRER